MVAQKKLRTKNLKLAFKTRQPPNLPKLLTTVKFKRLPIPKQIKQVSCDVKMFYMYLFAIIVTFLYWTN